MPSAEPVPRPGTRSPRLVVPVGILLVALLLRVGFVLGTRGRYVLRFDAADYVRLARQFAAGHDMTAYAPIFHTGWSAFRPPLYSLFLAPLVNLGGGVTAFRLAGSVIGTVTVGLFGLLARDLWGRRAGLAAMAVAAVYPAFVLLDSVVYSEVLFLPLLLLALLLATRAARRRSWRLAVLAGECGALATLERPNGFLVVLGVVVVLLSAPAGRSRERSRRRRQVVPAVAAVAAAALLLVPWTIRNEVRLHAFIPTTDAAGYDLSGTFNPTAAADRSTPGVWLAPFLLPEYADLFADKTLPEPRLNAELRHRAVSYAADHPGYVARSAWGSSERMLGLTGPGWSRRYSAVLSLGAGVGSVWFVGWWVLVATALALLPLWWRRLRGLAPALVVLAVLFTASALSSGGDPRYREPIEALLVLVVAAGASAAEDRLRGARHTHRIGPELRAPAGRHPVE